MAKKRKYTKRSPRWQAPAKAAVEVSEVDRFILWLRDRGDSWAYSPGDLLNLSSEWQKQRK